LTLSSKTSLNIFFILSHNRQSFLYRFLILSYFGTFYGWIFCYNTCTTTWCINKTSIKTTHMLKRIRKTRKINVYIRDGIGRRYILVTFLLLLYNLFETSIDLNSMTSWYFTWSIMLPFLRSFLSLEAVQVQMWNRATSIV
jgi:hypothetical protein